MYYINNEHIYCVLFICLEIYLSATENKKQSDNCDNFIYRCKIPNLDNDTYASQSQQHKDLINATIPILPDGSYDGCKIIVNGTLETCSEWVYDQSVFTRTVNSQVINIFSFNLRSLCPVPLNCPPRRVNGAFFWMRPQKPRPLVTEGVAQ